MRLRGLRVNRFGAFQDREWPDLQPGLNLLFGPNEAGKTTLMMFLRGMFFGFGKSAYDPLDNSEPGGSLRLLDARGQEWTLERSGRGKKARVLVSGPPGVLQGEAGLRPLLQEVSRPVYENIFAFSLKELQDLETLTKPREVQHLLYSASLGLGPVSLKAVEDRLHKQLKALFSADKKATNPEINQILVELARVRKEILKLEQQPQEYQELLTARARLEAEIQSLTQEEATVKHQALWLEKLSQAWKVWEECGLARETLAALPQIDAFPEAGLARWEKKKAELAQVEDQLDRWGRKLKEAREEADRPGPDQGLLQAAAAINSLAEERLRFEDRGEGLRQLEGKLTAVRSRLGESLARLGPEWDEDRLKHCRPSLNWQISIQEHQPRLEAAALAVRQAEDQVRLRLETLQEKETARNQAEAAGMFKGAAPVFFWGFGALALVLALCAGAAYLWYFRDLAGLLAVGAAMSAAAALFYVWQLRTHRRRLLRELEEERQRAQSALKTAESREEEERQKLTGLQDEWRAWLQNVSLDTALSPGGAAAFLQELAAARSLRQDLQELATAKAEVEAYLEDFTARLAEILAGLGRPPVPQTQVNQAIKELSRELDAALKLQDQRQQLAQKIRGTEKELADWEAKKQRLQTDLDHLLAAAGEKEEEGFRRRGAIFAERRELTGKIRELAAALRLLAGSDDALEQLEADLRRSAPADLEEGRRQAQTRIQNLKSRLEEALQQQGGWQNRLDALEQTAALSQALLTEQTLATALQDAARRWTAATLAGYFLEQARGCFEAEYQPQVLRRASQYFALLTAGRYPQVMAPLEGDSFMVINRQGSHVPPERLSRGTSEQLYLALRFALIQEYSQEGRSLPLILDDILVNFDQTRARQAILLLQEMSHSHQLLLFTCHPHVLNLIQETLGPAAPEPVRLEEKG